MTRYKLVGEPYTGHFGSWYENDYRGSIEKLNKMVGRDFNRSCDDLTKDNVVSIIVPHAGINYSGDIANSIYKKVLKYNDFDNILLLCTGHYNGNFVLPYFSRAYIVEKLKKEHIMINEEWVSQLLELECTKQSDKVFYGEHSFEMQLIFILYYIHKFRSKIPKLIPIIVGHSCSTNDLNKLSDKLKNMLNHESSVVHKRTLVVATTDFYHYGPKFNDVLKTDNIRVEEHIRNYDKDTFNIIKNNKDNNDILNRKLCGKYAIKLLMNIMRNGITNRNIEPIMCSYKLSDNVNLTINSNIVSYMTIIYKSDKSNNCANNIDVLKPDPVCGGSLSISLLQIPRITLIILGHIVEKGDISLESSIDDKYKAVHPYLKRMMPSDNILNDNADKKGVFVTFEHNTELRGCIGVFNENANDNIKYKDKSQIELIAFITLLTIFGDHRFKDHELKHIKNYVKLKESGYLFKLNLLEKNIKYGKIDAFWNVYKPCKHGIVLNYGGYSGTFLPSVMKEQNWINDCNTDYHKEESSNLRDEFENNVFNQLLYKISVGVSWKEVRESNNYAIELYESDEKDDLDFIEDTISKAKLLL